MFGARFGAFLGPVWEPVQNSLSKIDTHQRHGCVVFGTRSCHFEVLLVVVLSLFFCRLLVVVLSFLVVVFLVSVVVLWPC